MKKFSSLLVVALIALNFLANPAQSRKTTPLSVPATVTGTVVLQVSNSDKVSSIESLFYQGNDDSLPTLGKSIPVIGTYTSGSTVDVTEDVSEGTSYYSFTLPALEKILTLFKRTNPTATKSGTVKDGSITATFNKILNDGSGSINHITADMVAKDITVVKNNKGKGKIIGRLVGNGAKGRFTLNLSF